MKLGLTTNVFANALASGEASLRALVEYADSEGLAAVEIRDDSAEAPLNELERAISAAAARSVELSYAVKNDMLAEDDDRLIRDAVERAWLCGPGTVLRILASQPALAAPGKTGYSAVEIDLIEAACIRYSALAAEREVALAVEHAAEPLYGNPPASCGLYDLFAALEEGCGVPDNFGITFDPANAVFTALNKAPCDPERVFEFLAECNQYIAMVHFKTTKGGVLTPTIDDADVDSERLFEELSRVYNGVVCIEVPPGEDLLSCKANISASLEYMRQNGLTGFFAEKRSA